MAELARRGGRPPFPGALTTLRPTPSSVAPTPQRPGPVLLTAAHAPWGHPPDRAPNSDPSSLRSLRLLPGPAPGRPMRGPGEKTRMDATLRTPPAPSSGSKSPGKPVGMAPMGDRPASPGTPGTSDRPQGQRQFPSGPEGLGWGAPPSPPFPVTVAPAFSREHYQDQGQGKTTAFPVKRRKPNTLNRAAVSLPSRPTLRNRP